MTSNGNATVAGGARTLELAGRSITIEPPSGRKASRAFALLRAIDREAPELIAAWGEFETTYQAEHYTEIDRANAELHYGPEPLVLEGELQRYPDGHPKAGEPIMVPGALESMSEEAWRAVDNKLRLPERPSFGAKVANIIRHDAIERAEENVYRLVALFAMPNADVKRYRKDGSFNDRLEELVNDLLDDADLMDLVELAAVAGEVIDEQFRTKAEKLGGRLGNALRVLGLEPRTRAPQTATEAAQTASSPATPTPDSPATSTDTPSSSSSTSSGDGQTASDGTPTPSSTPTGEPSPALAGASTRSG